MPDSSHASGRSSPASASRANTSGPAPRARRLERPGPHDERHVGEVEIALRGQVGVVHAREQDQRRERADDRAEREPPEAVQPGDERDVAADRPEDHEAIAVMTEDRHERAEGDRERVLGRRAVDREHRQVQMEHVAPPDEGVVGVVRRVGREQEEPDEGPDAQGAEPELRPGASGHGPQARQPDGARPRPGERRAFHRAPAAERLGRGSPRLASSRFLWDTGWPVYATPWRSRAGGRPFGPSTLRLRCHEAHHPDSLLERGAAAACDARRPPSRAARVRHRRVADHRRRLDRRHGRGGQAPRGRPHRPPDEQQGAVRRLPGRPRRLPQARRGRHRQHRRRQPVLRPGHRQARRSRSSRAAPTWSSATAR